MVWVIKVTLGSHTAYLAKDHKGFVDSPSDANVGEYKTKREADAEAAVFGLFHTWADDKPMQIEAVRVP